jgi:enoyl-CoA hydratase/carnithine racemase
MPDPALLDVLIAEGGAGLVIQPADGGAPRAGPGALRVGVHREGPRPAAGLVSYDNLLTIDPGAPRPWVSLAPERLEEALARLKDVAMRQPAATAVAAQVFRMTLSLSFEQSLTLESLGYSMLLASEGLIAWRAATPVRARVEPDAPRVLQAFEDGVYILTLNRPQARNGVDARMRDALAEALAFALEDPDAGPVLLRGAGPSFSAGGDLDEFGQAKDPGAAHLVRVLRSPAGLLHRLGARATVIVHGACVGAGIEMPAAAGRVVARPDAWFRLPEVAMGLIPGAGGTASIPRRIGRRRACYMAVTGWDVDAATALAWGLVDAVEPAP